MSESHMHAKMETLLGVVVFLGVIGFGSYIVNSLAPTQAVVERISAIILGATGLVLIWYTVETKRLRVQAQRQVEEIQQQTEAQVRPFVIVEPIFTEDTSHGNFHARNVGNGTAINVRVWFVRVQLEVKRLHRDNLLENDAVYAEISFPDNESILFRRPPIYFLTPHQTSGPIEISSQTKTGERSSSGRFLYPNDANSIFMLRIHFENVNGQKYFVEETIRHRTLKILRSGRWQDTTVTDLIGIANEEEPYLTEKGRTAARNWISQDSTSLP